MAKKKEEKPLLERTYVIPLKKDIMKSPRYKRAEKAIRVIRIFLAKHMKVPDRDISKIKLDLWLNRALWLRGIKNPPYKITVKAIKDAEGIVKVEFVGLPAKYKAEETKLLKKKTKIEAKVAKKEKAEEEKKKKEAEAKKAEEEKKKKEAEKEKSEEKAKLGKKAEEKSEEEKIEEKEKKEKEKALHKETAKPKPKELQEKHIHPDGKKEKQVMFRKTLEK